MSNRTQTGCHEPCFSCYKEYQLLNSRSAEIEKTLENEFKCNDTFHHLRRRPGTARGIESKTCLCRGIRCSKKRKKKAPKATASHKATTTEEKEEKRALAEDSWTTTHPTSTLTPTSSVAGRTPSLTFLIRCDAGHQEPLQSQMAVS